MGYNHITHVWNSSGRWCKYKQKQCIIRRWCVLIIRLYPPLPKHTTTPPTHILHTPQIWSSNAMQSHNHNHMNRLMYDSKTHGTVPPSTSITHGADLVPDVKRVNGNKGLLLTLLFWILHCSVLPLRRSSLSWCRGWVGHQSRCMRPKHFQPPTAVNKSKSCGSVS